MRVLQLFPGEIDDLVASGTEQSFACSFFGGASWPTVVVVFSFAIELDDKFLVGPEKVDEELMAVHEDLVLRDRSGQSVSVDEPKNAGLGNAFDLATCKGDNLHGTLAPRSVGKSFCNRYHPVAGFRFSFQEAGVETIGRAQE